MTVPDAAVTCPECGHPARSPAHYIDVGRRHGELEGAAAERDRNRELAYRTQAVYHHPETGLLEPFADLLDAAP